MARRCRDLPQATLPPGECPLPLLAARRVIRVKSQNNRAGQVGTRRTETHHPPGSDTRGRVAWAVAWTRVLRGAWSGLVSISRSWDFMSWQPPAPRPPRKWGAFLAGVALVSLEEGVTLKTPSGEAPDGSYAIPGVKQAAEDQVCLMVITPNTGEWRSRGSRAGTPIKGHDPLLRSQT